MIGGSRALRFRTGWSLGHKSLYLISGGLDDAPTESEPEPDPCELAAYDPRTRWLDPSQPVSASSSIQEAVVGRGSLSSLNADPRRERAVFQSLVSGFVYQIPGTIRYGTFRRYSS